MVRSQDRLAGARSADETQDLAAHDIEVDTCRESPCPESDGDVARRKHDVAPRRSSQLPGLRSACIISELDRCVEHGEQPVEDDDDEDRLHHRGGDMLAEQFGAAADLHALRPARRCR